MSPASKILTEVDILKALTRIKSALNLNKFFRALILAGLFLSASPGLFASDAFNSLVKLAPEASVPAVPEPAASEPAQDPAASARGLKAYFISVGQGDAEYIELPNGKNVLIDGGPADPNKPDYPPVARFLEEHNVTKLDYVVLTHPHSDHYEGLQYVFSKIKVGHFYDTRMDNTGAAGDDTLRAQVKKLGVDTTYPDAGDTLDWDRDVSVKVFNGYPRPGQSADGNALNDSSIVFKVTYQKTSILYTGDVQDDMVPLLELKAGGELRADVLKVSHHGSPYATGTELLNKVLPKVAYIEVGENNFGHPSSAVLSRLKAIGAKVYRTDLDGTQLYTIGAAPSVNAGDAAISAK